MKLIPAFYFEPEALAPVAARWRDSFRTAQPFQHVVLDEFLPCEVIELLIGEFPGPDDIAWELHGPGRTEWKKDPKVAKLATYDETKFGAFTRHFMGQLNSATFLAFLEELTGTKGIIPDPSYSHCGMHSTGPGGRLMMHTDVNRHPHGCQMHQYLNLILYLNQDWKDEYGGHLELWNERRQPVRKILPSANRVVLFNTGTRSLHGHPHPLTCPPGRRRNSLAVYYYLRDRPASEEYAGMQRSVHWVAATESDRAFARERTAQALGELATLEGRSVGVAPVMIPFEVPASLIDARTGHVPLYFLRASEFADAPGFVRTHLAAAAAHLGLSAAEFLAAHRPIALLGAKSSADVSSPTAVPCLLDGVGDVYVVRSPEERELFWVGYLDEILASIPRV
jgi:Rps23 Pro-64 3,4-dihydroxylase Tpa1-like proline 4-hydroxylase